MFKPTITISSDVMRQYEARNNSSNKKWFVSEVEDGGGGIVPYEYKAKNYVNALQWLIGLEIFLLVKDPSRVFLQQIIQMEPLLLVIQIYFVF